MKLNIVALIIMIIFLVSCSNSVSPKIEECNLLFEEDFNKGDNCVRLLGDSININDCDDIINPTLKGHILNYQVKCKSQQYILKGDFEGCSNLESYSEELTWIEQNGCYETIGMNNLNADVCKLIVNGRDATKMRDRCLQFVAINLK